MHTMSSNGVAGTHISLLCQELAANNVGLDILRSYTSKFRLPRARDNKASDLFFKDELISTDHVRHFAADVLGMVIIMYAFLAEKISPRFPALHEHVKAFRCLFKILCTLRKGELVDGFRTR